MSMSKYRIKSVDELTFELHFCNWMRGGQEGEF